MSVSTSATNKTLIKQPIREPLADTEVDQLLQATSRTFALAIPLLPQPLKRQVGVAYLLFRIADTIEDADLLDRESKVELLDEFLEALGRTERHLSERDDQPFNAEDTTITSSVRDQRLFYETDRVLETVARFPVDVRSILLRHVRSSARGMQSFLIRSSTSGQQLSTLPELRSYCFCVAGLVGEMLTRLFIHHQASLAEVSHRLMEKAAVFGEGLQLVNILKDSARDRAEGRCFIPPRISRGHLFEQARYDLQQAEEYTRLLQQCKVDFGILRFTQLPVQLAWLTLSEVEECGEGAKVPREKVAEVLQRLVGSHLPEPSR